MKNGLARALAIIALVFMVIFIAALIATVIDRTLLNGSVGYIALGCGVFVMMIFLALRADGRGFSITKMNNEIEMKKIEEELKKQQEQEQREKEAKAREQSADGEISTDASEASEKTESECKENPSEQAEKPEVADAKKTEKAPQSNGKSKKKKK